MSRLEEIKMRFEKTLMITGKQNGKTLFGDDIEWLFKQAERAEKLQDALESTLLVSGNVKEKLEAENNRYKQALEFYADEENYKPFDGISLSSYQNKIDEDGGQTASKALEG